MDSIKISIEEAGKISNLLLEYGLLLELERQNRGGKKEEPPAEIKELEALRASLYKKITQAQKKSGKRRSEKAELESMIKALQREKRLA